jgi:hypothetical protein
VFWLKLPKKSPIVPPPLPKRTTRASQEIVPTVYRFRCFEAAVAEAELIKAGKEVIPPSEIPPF